MLVAWEAFTIQRKLLVELLPMTPLCRHRLIVNIIIIIMITTELHGT